MSLEGARPASHRDWVLDTGASYWPTSRERVAELPLPRIDAAARGALVTIELPDWAADLGVGTPPSLLVDRAACLPGEGLEWTRCDWLQAAFFHLVGAAEAVASPRTEDSYFFRMPGLDPRLHERAWVNRIFRLLRRWSARRAGRSEEQVFGSLPQARIHLTHDVDAIRKTPEMRLKRGAFGAWSAFRSLREGRVMAAARRLRGGAAFALKPAVPFTLSRVREIEEKAGLRSTLHFYGGPPGKARRHPLRILLDPAYDVEDPRLTAQIRGLADGGWSIGVHPSYASHLDVGRIREERSRVERAAKRSVASCRQHWLRFAWERTWRAQEEAGLQRDGTLGFNDRPGLRNGAALRFRPWDRSAGRALAIEAIPMMLMDSHLYDYQPMGPEERRETVRAWLEEVRLVGGEASVNWHTHTLAADFGWEPGFRELVALLS